MTHVRLKTDVTMTGGAVSTFRKGMSFWIANEVETSGGVRFRLCDWRGVIVMQIRPELVELVEE